MELVIVFDPQESCQAEMDVGTTGRLLKQLEESKTTAMKQKVGDEILAQFRFQ